MKLKISRNIPTTVLLKLNIKIYRKMFIFMLSMLTITLTYIFFCDNSTTIVIEKVNVTQKYVRPTHLSTVKTSTTVPPATSSSVAISVTKNKNNSTVSIVEKTTHISLHDTSQNPIASSPTKVILFHSHFHYYRWWKMGKETHTEIDLKNLKCPVTNCILTHNRNFFNRSDFLLFFVSGGGKPDIPKTRNVNQSYVMFTIESPAHVGIKYAKYPGMFNLTLTSRLDSDIYMRYGIVREKSTGEQVAPNFKPLWNKVDTNMSFLTSDDKIIKMIRSKNVTAAWFVSHCKTYSRREILTKQLQSRGIDVDIYGGCGTKRCSFGSAACDRLLNSTYKFYFAFENSLYDDYVTEKVFNNMKNFIVPVVFNGADMSRFLPPKSYINAQDFKTVAELAAHLKFLAKNETEYMKYFWWRKYYDIESQPYIPICDLCAKAHQSVHKTYDNVFEWYKRDQSRKCRIPF